MREWIRIREHKDEEGIRKVEDRREEKVKISTG